MGYFNPVLNKSFGVAGADLSGHEGRAVKINTSGNTVACGAGEQSVGTLLNKPTAGQAPDIGVIGIQNVVAGAAFTVMDLLAADADGKYVKATPGATPIALALETAAGANSRCAALVLGGGGDRGVPTFTLTAGANDAAPGGANTILVSAQLKNANGENVAVATKYYAKSFDAGATLSDGGVGTVEAGSTTVEIAGTTNAAGLAEILVSDAAAESVVIMVVPERGGPTFITLVFT